ncbi:hypothetical protein C8R44DRAFT_883185 [Mycena epipterygia]|nr:hypothetical protein C8R44DRAFT_883185 [Mycena epipterygia]
MHDVRRLFEHSTPQLQSLFIHQCEEEFSLEEPAFTTSCARPKIKQLRLSGIMSHAWLLNHSCPFDFSELCNVDCSRARNMEAIELLLDRSRLTISTLKLDTRHASHAEAGLSGLKGFGGFPSLTHLTIISLNFYDVDTLLASLLPSNRLAVLRLEMSAVGMTRASLLSLGSTLARMSLPALRRIEALVIVLIEKDCADMDSHVRTAFAGFGSRCQLEVEIELEGLW